MDGPIEGGSHNGGRIISRLPVTKLYHIESTVDPQYKWVVESYEWRSDRWVFIGAESNALDERDLAFIDAARRIGAPEAEIAHALQHVEVTDVRR